MKVVIVESPAKAKTINKYLGDDFEVFASYGHVRDLPAKDGSVMPDNDFEMTYETDAGAKKNLSNIARALKGSDTLYLATDPDREGEAISWHVLEALKDSRSLPKNIDVKRITFDEITKRAVLAAIDAPRDIDMDLVNAQQARRALDYLVGFTLSPVLWRKLPGSRSAGRVQSVALRLICERDAEIEQFEPREYWDIKADMTSTGGEAVLGRLTHWQDTKLEKFSITNEKRAMEITGGLKGKSFAVSNIEPKLVRRHPAAPFTTSTLQQEASRKLGFGAKKTMTLAQKLYEGFDIGGETTGLITYMRTDAVTVSREAVVAARSHIGNEYGKEYLPDVPRAYKTKTKNAQEAHEAIRPTDVTRTPEMLSRVLDKDMLRLYELVWKRLVASQMESAVFDQLIVDITSTDKEAVFRTTGSVIKFDGFLKLYQEGKDEESDEDKENRLPALKPDEKLDTKKIMPEQHFTEPPPRYSEASLVKKLEELGIGRPSTYAAIISVLQDRGYVTLDRKRFVAEPLGRIVSAFLVSYFERYVEYGFTAALEEQLDDISNGEREWKKVLRDFWTDFIAKIEDSKELSVSDVLEEIDSVLDSYVFGEIRKEKRDDARTCPSCSKGTLGLKLGKYGPYIGCSAYPDCTYRAQLADMRAGGVDPDSFEMQLPITFGKDPETDEDVALKKGPYGFYVQRGDGKTPKRVSLMKGMNPEEIDFETALALLSLPRELGSHPDSGKPILAGVGRYGPYLQHDGKFTSLPPEESPLTIGINRAVDVLANAPKKGGGQSTLKDLGEHPDGGEVKILNGRYGPYIKHAKTNAPIPKGTVPEDITLEKAIELIAARASKTGKGKPTKAAAKKPAAKKPPTKKTPAKKTAAKKPAAKKSAGKKASGA